MAGLVLFEGYLDSESDEALVDDSRWEEELRASDRPEELVARLIGLWLLLQAAARRVPGEVTIPRGGTPTAIADVVTVSVNVSLKTYLRDALGIIRGQAPGVTQALSDYARRQAGLTATPVTSSPAQALVQAAEQYLTGNVDEVRTLSQAAIERWSQVCTVDIRQLRAALDTELGAVEWRTKRVLTSELQRAYVDLARSAFGQAGVRWVRRLAMPGACARCKALAGAHEATAPDLYWTHPHCACVWVAVREKEGRMSKLTKAQRDKLPLDDFGWPERRLYPIVDQDDVDSAASLLGKAPESERETIKKRIAAIARRKKLALPDAWQTDARMSVEFGLGDGATSGGWVIRRGKIFEAGHYPDKDNFYMSPEELMALAADFTQPVPLDLEHVPTVLDGKLGELRKVETSEDGWELYGEVALPDWLDTLLADTPRKVSVAIDTAARRLSKLALVLDPRVPDAALMSAFTAASGQPGPDDMETLRGAALRFVELASRRHSAADMRDIQAIHELTVKQGAVCAPRKLSKERGMNETRWDRFKKWLMGEGAEDAIFAETPTGEGAGSTGVSAPAPTVVVNNNAPPPPPALANGVLPVADPRVARELAELRAENDRLRMDGIKRDSATFADSEIAAGRAVPAEHDALVAAYIQAAQDDAAHGSITFSDGQRISRVDSLKALYAARPAHLLTKEVLAETGQSNGAGVQALPNKQTTDDPKTAKPVTKERRKELLGKSTLGQTVLRAEQRGGD